MVKPLRAGLLLSRVPIVVPKPSAFAQAYYRYMGELERRLMWTFPSYFYFKRGTLAQRRFNDLQRGPMPRHKGVYYPDGIPDVHHNRERRSKQEVRLGSDEQEKIEPQPRTTKADSNNDVKSLARKLDSTLYLVVKQGEWRFPSFEVADSDPSLHEAAEAGLRKMGGELINTWTVSPTPAGVLHVTQEPEFLIKSHILHGQFAPKENVEYAWLTKDEIKERVPAAYFEQVEALL